MLRKQKRFIETLVIVSVCHFFSGELQPQLKIKDMEVNKFLENNFSVNWKLPVCLSGAMSGLREVIYPQFILIRMEYL